MADGTHLSLETAHTERAPGRATLPGAMLSAPSVAAASLAGAAPPLLSVSSVLALQRLAGNQAVRELLARPSLARRPRAVTQRTELLVERKLDVDAATLKKRIAKLLNSIGGLGAILALVETYHQNWTADSVDQLKPLAQLLELCDQFLASDGATNKQAQTAIAWVREKTLIEITALVRAAVQGNTSIDELSKRFADVPALKKLIQSAGDLVRKQKKLNVAATAKFPGIELGSMANLLTLLGKESLIIVNAQATGDMHHVRATRAFFPELRVLIYVAPTETRERRTLLWKQACDWAPYVGDAAEVFCIRSIDFQLAKIPSKKNAYDFFETMYDTKKQRPKRIVEVPTGIVLTVGDCSTLIGLVMDAARGNKRYAHARRGLASFMAPRQPEQHEAAFWRDLTDHGFSEGGKYLILNYRQSGHTGGFHPEMDTGIVGIRQLEVQAQKVATRTGRTLVFMGEEPSELRDAKPTLIDYFLWPSCKDQSRLVQAGLLRVLREKCDLQVLAMRSGVTDQLAFLDIPVLSIDLDTFLTPQSGRESGEKKSKKHGFEFEGDAVNQSWARGLKMEQAFLREYGRVFLKNLRSDLQTDMDREENGRWKGIFDLADLDRIAEALELYFATGTGLARHTSHPLSPSGELNQFYMRTYDGVTKFLRSMQNEIVANADARAIEASLATTPKEKQVEVERLLAEHRVVYQYRGQEVFGAVMQELLSAIPSFRPPMPSQVGAALDVVQQRVADLHAGDEVEVQDTQVRLIFSVDAVNLRSGGQFSARGGVWWQCTHLRAESLTTGGHKIYYTIKRLSPRSLSVA